MFLVRISRLLIPLAALVVLAAAAGCATDPGPRNFSLQMCVADDIETPGFLKVAVPNSREVVYVSPVAELDENDVKKAEVLPTPEGPGVAVTFTRGGARKLERMTEKNRNRLLAIILDRKLVVAPPIYAPITGGRMLIHARFTQSEAQALADRLNGKSPPPGSPPPDENVW